MARLILDTGVLVAGPVPVLGDDEAVAEHPAELPAHTQRAGEPRGVHDLVVTAIARSRGARS